MAGTRPPAGPAMTSEKRACASTGSLAADYFAEAHPLLAFEADELHLLDRREILGAGVDADARQQHRQSHVEARRLSHHVLAREIVAALPQHLDERLRHGIAVDVEA